jgi:acyl carrier protein
MSSPSATRVPEIVSEILVELLAAQPTPIHLDDEDILKRPIAELGIDSILLVQFLTDLESRFNISFSDDDLDAANFSSHSTVCALMEQYVGSQELPHVNSTSRAVQSSTVDVPEYTEWLPADPVAMLLLSTARIHMSAEHVRKASECLRLEPQLDWGAFLDLATKHRVLGLVARNFDRECLGPLGTVRRATLRATYLYNRGRAQAWERERRDLFACFAANGLTPVVRKGAYLAKTVYDDPAVRYMEDMDLYVTADQAGKVAEVLRGLGYQQGTDSPDRRTIVPLDRTTSLFWHLNVAAMPPFLRPTSDPYIDVFSIDLRRDLMEPASGKTIPAEDFRDRAKKVTLLGRPVWVPSDEDMLLDLSVHLFREATTLSSIRSSKDLCLIRFIDIVQWYGRIEATLDADLLLSLAETYQVGNEVYYALHFTDLLYPNVIDQKLLNDFRPADLSYLDYYGELDNQPDRWPVPFLERVFDRHRLAHVKGFSALPRPRTHWTDDHGPTTGTEHE